MFCSRKTNNKINKLHERALRLVYNDNESSFENLLEIDHSFCIHHQNIQTLAIEMYKINYGLAEGSFKDLFENMEEHRSYNLRSKSKFLTPSVNTESKGKNSIRYLGPIIWSSVPTEIRNAETIILFKKQIRKWKPENCPCKLCQHFVNGVGFVTLG